MAAAIGTIPSLSTYQPGALPIASTVYFEIVDSNNATTAQSWNMVLQDIVGKAPSVMNYNVPVATDMLAFYQKASGLPMQCQVGDLAIPSGNLPAGGGTGTLLAKVSATSFSANWTTISNLVTTTSGLTNFGTATAFIVGIQTAAILSSMIATNAIGSTQLASGSIGTSQIIAGSIGSTQLGAGAVLSTNISANTITGAQIANNAIGTAQLQTNAGIPGTFSVGTQFTVGGTSTLNGGLQVLGTSLLTGVLDVLGTALFTSGNFGVVGTALFTSGTFGVVGTSLLTGTFTVVGTAVFTGSDNFSVLGTSTFTGAHFVNGTALFTSGTFGVVGTALFTSGAFGIVGTATFTSGAFNVIGTTLFTSGAFGVVGTATFTSTFGIIGTTLVTTNAFGVIGTSTFTGAFVLGSQGAGVLTSSATGVVSAQGGMVLLNTLTPNNVASTNDTTSLTAAYRTYMVTFDNVCPATQTTALQMQIATSGSNWVSGGYVSNASVLNGVGIGEDTSTTALLLTGITTGRAMQTTLTYGASGFIKILNPSSTVNRKQIVGQISYVGPGAPGTATINMCLPNGWFDAAVNPVTGINFLISSGNIQTGTIKIYGIT